MLLLFFFYSLGTFILTGQAGQKKEVADFYGGFAVRS